MPVAGFQRNLPHQEHGYLLETVLETEDLAALQEFHIGKLRSNLDAGGDASLMNGLDMAVDSLKSIPSYGHREVHHLYLCLLQYACTTR